MAPSFTSFLVNMVNPKLQKLSRPLTLACLIGMSTFAVFFYLYLQLSGQMEIKSTLGLLHDMEQFMSQTCGCGFDDQGKPEHCRCGYKVECIIGTYEIVPSDHAHPIDYPVQDHLQPKYWMERLAGAPPYGLGGSTLAADVEGVCSLDRDTPCALGPLRSGACVPHAQKGQCIGKVAVSPLHELTWQGTTYNLRPSLRPYPCLSSTVSEKYNKDYCTTDQFKCNHVKPEAGTGCKPSREDKNSASYDPEGDAIQECGLGDRKFALFVTYYKTWPDRFEALGIALGYTAWIELGFTFMFVVFFYLAGLVKHTDGGGGRSSSLLETGMMMADVAGDDDAKRRGTRSVASVVPTSADARLQQLEEQMAAVVKKVESLKDA